MKLGEKEIKDYWAIVKIPTFIIIGWYVVGLIFSAVAYQIYQSVFQGIAGWLILVAYFGFIGWVSVKEHKLKPSQAGWAGAVGGIVIGFVGGIFSILTYFLLPSVIDQAVMQAVAKGAPEATVRSMMSITIYFGVIIAPVINGLVGWVLSAITGLVAKKIK